MSANSHSALETVTMLLQMRGITPSDKEIAHLATAYPAAREIVETLYAMPGVRYEEPAITFDPRI